MTTYRLYILTPDHFHLVAMTEVEDIDAATNFFFDVDDARHEGDDLEYDCIEDHTTEVFDARLHCVDGSYIVTDRDDWTWDKLVESVK